LECGSKKGSVVIIKKERVEIIRKRYSNKWLLIAVDEMDESTTIPIRGHLLAHSKDRDEIYKKMMRYKIHTFVTCSEDKLRKGLAVAFSS
jgi:hypothetical protein